MKKASRVRRCGKTASRQTTQQTILLVIGALWLLATVAGGAASDPAARRARQERRIQRVSQLPVLIEETSGSQAQPADVALRQSSEAQTTALVLPNQWRLTPPGTSLPLGDLPVSMTLDPSGRYAAVLHAGFSDHELRLIDLVLQRESSRARLPNTWVGATFSPDGRTLYVSGGADDRIHVFSVNAGRLDRPTSISLRRDRLSTASQAKPWHISGLAVEPRSGKLLVACQQSATLLRWDPARPHLRPRPFVRFREPHAAPYKIVVHPRRPRAYVSLWGAKAVAVVDLTRASYRLIPTHAHPTDMVLSPDGRFLFVACANTNFTDVIDLAKGRVVEHLDSGIYPGIPPGSTPNGLALSRDGRLLAVANADTNHLALFDVSQPGQTRPRGMIPTGWYPTAVAFGPKGDLVIVNGKGHGSSANPNGPDPYEERAGTHRNQYIAQLFRGTMSFVAMPDEEQLARLTARVLANSPLRPDLAPQPRTGANPIPARVGDPCPIRYCVYIIKENRTYDQVFGDMPQGNGDPSLCLFGEKVTPNHHALASEFVLLDNFYTEAEVSADGHEWSMGAYATDFVEKTWPSVYGGHGKLGYPAEGNHPLGRPEGGYIWNRARAAGISYRSYGEWVENGGKACQGKAKDPALVGHFDPCYSGFDMDVSDLDRADRFIAELRRFEREGDMPRLVILRLPNDHTAGTRAGKPTPRAYVAQNDLALGRVVEALSHSRFWPKMAIFVVEDDAQNGPDHVDAHRTVALVIGPYVKRRAVCHSLFSTASMLRTMELILGLAPMSQFDAAAAPLYELFTERPDLTPYTARPATWPLDEKNPPHAPMQRESAALDLRREDSAPDVLFNEIIWKSVHGADSSMPPPVRAAFVRPREHEPDED